MARMLAVVREHPHKDGGAREGRGRGGGGGGRGGGVRPRFGREE